jgi:hypothetical protein
LVIAKIDYITQSKLLGMTDNFFLILAAILCLPILPAFVIYKFLPESSTEVDGPYKKLNLKLRGAFAGYFLLVLIGVGLQWAAAGSQQTKQIEALNRTVAHQDSLLANMKSAMAASANPVIDWKVKGLVQPGEKEGTRFFFDDGTTTKSPDGSFELIKRVVASVGRASPPKWICVYNPITGYRVVSLNREVNHPDITAFDVAFNDSAHEILIRKPIDINSAVKDSVVAVAGFLNSNPELKDRVEAVNPQFLIKAEAIRKVQMVEKAQHMPKLSRPVSGGAVRQ